MEDKIHLLEQDAYYSVLRAFKAQGDAITWDKESLITELRKELRLTDDQHRELLARANSDNLICEIREWRQAGGNLNVRLSSSLPVQDVPNPTVSASRKKQKTILLSTTLPGSSSMKPMQHSSSVPSGSRQLSNPNTSGPLLANEPAEAPPPESFIGRKVWIRWPDDNSFYEAVIREYDPIKGQYALVYDIKTARETWEWVDLKEIPPEDIRWESDDSGMTTRGGRRGQSRVNRTSQSSGGLASGYGRGRASGSGRGRGISKSQPRKEPPLSLDNVGKIMVDDIEMFNTGPLINEVERVLGSSNPDPVEVEKARKVLKDQEQALMDALAKLSYASDGESEGKEPNVNITKDDT